jgi:1,4-dihydroxy-2-naphthoyl-CoA synthase
VSFETTKLISMARSSSATTSPTTAPDQGTVRIAFNRPEVRNAFRPQTVDELYTALDHAR